MLAFHSLVICQEAPRNCWRAESTQRAAPERGAGPIHLFPLPLLDGGRILIGILPKAFSRAVAQLEPYGLAILIGLFIVLPVLGAQLGVDLNIISPVLGGSTRAVLNVIIHITGNA